MLISAEVSWWTPVAIYLTNVHIIYYFMESSIVYEEGCMLVMVRAKNSSILEGRRAVSKGRGENTFI